MLSFWLFLNGEGRWYMQRPFFFWRSASKFSDLTCQTNVLLSLSFLQLRSTFLVYWTGHLACSTLKHKVQKERKNTPMGGFLNFLFSFSLHIHTLLHIWKVVQVGRNSLFWYRLVSLPSLTTCTLETDGMVNQSINSLNSLNHPLLLILWIVAF